MDSLLGMLLTLVIMTVAFAMIFGKAGAVIGLWDKHLLQPVKRGLWQLVTLPFRLLGRGLRALLRWTGRAAWRGIRAFFGYLWHGSAAPPPPPARRPAAQRPTARRRPRP
jgi:hypothetical protein